MMRFLRHFFVPHEANNHRAKLLHHSSLLVIIVGLFVLGGLFSFTAKHDQTVLGISYSINPDELLLLTNIKRQEAGLPVLTLNASLSEAASRKAQDMFAKNYWAHIAPDGTTPWYFIRSSGYEYVYAGENLARGYTTSNSVVDAWMASPSHRENMLSPNYTEIGFGILEGSLTGDDTVLVVELMGTRTRTTASTQQVVPEPIVTSAPIPTAVPVQPVGVTPTPTLVPTAVPTVITPTPSLSPLPITQIQVAAFKNDPLINKPTAQKSIAIGVILVLAVALLLDLMVARQHGFVRLLSHNIDHIIFFGMILIIIILMSGGFVL